MRYVLDEAGEPRPEPDLLTWARWMEEANRVVASDRVGPLHVSTVFLGLDHGFGFHGSPPTLWETMIFGAPAGSDLCDYQERYRSRAAALEGHQAALALARAAIPGN